jgi:hypothetical protein
LGSWLVFEQFLPEAAQDVATFEADGLEARVRFDRACVENMGEPVTDDLIGKWLNISVARVLVDVSLPKLTSDLERFVCANEDWPKRGVDILQVSADRDRALAGEYQLLGHRVLRVVLGATNRLAAWAYAECGQYWVKTRPLNVEDVMMSRNNEFGARLSLPGGASFRWCPPSQHRLVHQEGPSERITPDRWRSAMKFIASNGRPSLVGELLSNAEALMSSGRHRSAVLEAVCALEVAVAHFADRPEPHALARKPGGAGMSFASDLEHLGFSRFVKYLLPLVVTPAEMAPGDLEGAAEAIECRNRLAHGKHLQRSIGSAVARKHVGSLRRVILRLRAMTLKTPTHTPRP